MMAIQDSMLCQKKSQIESGMRSPVGARIETRTMRTMAMIIMKAERQRTVPRASLRLRSILTFQRRAMGTDITVKIMLVNETPGLKTREDTDQEDQ